MAKVVKKRYLYHMINEGLSHESRFVVGKEDTAAVIGSGDLAVLATPTLIAWMENAAMLSVSDLLPAGETTVGGKIDMTHLRPSAIGTEVEVCANLIKVDGKKLTFQVAAQDKAGNIAEGTHIRFIVDKERFMGKLGG